MLNPDVIDSLEEDDYTSLFTSGSASANIAQATSKFAHR